MEINFDCDERKIKDILSKDHWEKLNEVLYNYVEDNPSHKDQEAVFTKLILIGRTYAASIERGKKHKEKTNDFFWKISKELGNFPFRFNLIPEFNESTVSEVVKQVEELSYFLKKHTDKRRISFSSKYLHFHNPEAFPIFDSTVVNNLNTLFESTAGLKKYKKELNLGKGEYSNFCCKLLFFKKYLKEKNTPPLTLRELDSLLLTLSRKLHTSAGGKRSLTLNDEGGIL